MRVVLVMGALYALLLASVYLITSRVVSAYQSEQAERAVARLNGALDYEKGLLDGSVQTQAAMLANSREPAASAFSPEDLQRFGWTGFIVLRSGRTAEVASELSADDSRLQPMPEALVRQAAGLVERQLSRVTGQKRPLWLKVETEVYLASMAPLPTNEAAAPGVLVALRRLDTDFRAKLWRFSGVEAHFTPVAGTGQTTPRGLLTLDGAGEYPVGTFQIDHASIPAPSVGRIVTGTGITALVLAVAGFFALACLLRRNLVRRLKALTKELEQVQQRENSQNRLIVQNDETSALVREINHLLGSSESAQASLERANAEMQQRVAERTTALADANAALEADISERIKAEQERERLREQLTRSHKMEAVGTLAGGIAHDFNNILAGILGHAHLIASDIPSDHVAQNHVRQVLAAGERAAALVRQILAFSRQTPGEHHPVSVGKIAREALSLLRAALPAGIAIRCQVDAVIDIVDADPTQLHQVFMNLGANAGHAMGSKGGELSIVISNLTVSEDTAGLHAGEYVVIEVRDTGCGMTPDVMERIFDPFFSTKPVNEGTGLGLAVVHGIITDHGGTISVQSHPGQGTSFRILLPAAAPLDATANSRHAMPLPGSERILIVDDEEMVLNVLSKSLGRLGYRVVQEQNSLKALKLFMNAPENFDLLITDQTMPDMSGLELGVAVRTARPDLPIVLITGYSPEVSGHDASALGVSAIVSKPIDIAELTAVMRLAFGPRN